MLLGVAGFKALEGPHADVILLIKSLLFIADPHRDPILFVGWSLNYEMMFYAIFALCLFLNDVRLRITILVGAITALWLVGMTFPAGSYVRYMADGRILEFAVGVLLWHISAKFLLPSWAAFAALALGLGGLLLPDLGVRSALALTPSAFLLVYAAVSLEEHGFSVGRGFWKRQGDASYSTYLTHPFAIVILSKLAIVSHLNGSTAGLWIIVIAMFPIAATLGYLFHRKVEVPLTAWVRGIAKPRQLAAA
jgi:peptidoglycan/LPS O-acetylase OafA/YrhL